MKYMLDPDPVSRQAIKNEITPVQATRCNQMSQCARKIGELPRQLQAIVVLVVFSTLAQLLVFPPVFAQESPLSNIEKHVKFLPWMDQDTAVEFRFKSVFFLEDRAKDTGIVTSREYHNEGFFRFCGNKFLYRVSDAAPLVPFDESVPTAPGERIIAYDGAFYYQANIDQHAANAKMGSVPDFLSDGTLIFSDVPALLPFEPLLSVGGQDPLKALPGILRSEKFLITLWQQAISSKEGKESLEVNFRLSNNGGDPLRVVFDLATGYPTTSVVPDPEKRRGFLIREIVSWIPVAHNGLNFSIPGEVRAFWANSPTEKGRHESVDSVVVESVKVLDKCDEGMFRPSLPDGSVWHNLDTSTEAQKKAIP